jgi:excisionase family DNA binding protein
MGNAKNQNRVPPKPLAAPAPVATKMLSLEDAAARLGISGFTLRAWVRKRVLAHYRCGRRIVFDEATLARFLAARRVPAKDEAAPLAASQ